MLRLNTEITQAEYDLLETIKEIEFGEMFGVEIAAGGEKNCSVLLSKCQRDLIEAIRNGVQDISVLSIHNSEPVFAEVDEVIRGFRCRKKIKFPTSH